MGGIMTYDRLRERNGLARTGEPHQDPYEPYTGVGVNPGMLLGDWNRFERDLLGLSCWCNKHVCCEHDWDRHVARPLIGKDGSPTEYHTLSECTACDCEKWDPQPYHRGGEVCPDNTYAQRVADEADTDVDTVRAVLTALMTLR